MSQLIFTPETRNNAIAFDKPHEIIVEDMAGDFVNNLYGLHRRIDRVLDQRAADIVMVSTYTQAIFSKNDLLSVGSVPELFGELHVETIAPIVRRVATAVGGSVLSNIVLQSRLPDNYHHRFGLKGDGWDGKISPDQWMRQIWTPDYTERLVAVATLHDVLPAPPVEAVT